MQILTISGSARPNSSNVQLLKVLPNFLSNATFFYYDQLQKLPLFTATMKPNETVKDWQLAVRKADAVIICTPEYIHNVPALLKNALEWLVDSGELYEKRVLPMTLTPYPPRGEKAMQSLIWSLQAMDANIIGQLPLYLEEIEIKNDVFFVRNEIKQLIEETLNILS